jgi:DNA-binding transcriptional MerR regulator
MMAAATRFAVPEPEPDGLTSAEMSRAAGVTKRQLDWWCARHALRPSLPEARWRVYARDQVREVALLRALREKRVGLAKCKRLLAKVRRENAFARKGACLVFDAEAKFVRIETTAAAICDAAREYDGGVFVVGLGAG